MTTEQRQSIINDSIIETMIKYRNTILELENQSQKLSDIHYELFQKYSSNRNKEVRQALYNYNHNRNQIRGLEQNILQLFMSYKPQNQNDDGGPYWCKYPDEWGNPIPMTKVKGSKVMSKKEVQELNKIKLPF